MGFMQQGNFFFSKAKMLGLSLPCITLITFFSMSDCLTLFQRLKQEHSHVIGVEYDITVPAFFSFLIPKNFMLLNCTPNMCHLEDNKDMLHVFVIFEMTHVGCIIQVYK